MLKRTGIGLLVLVLVSGLAMFSCGGGGGGGGGGGPLDLTGAPSITSTTGFVGATLNASYSGPETVTYEWRRSGNANSLGIGTTYTANNAGTYSVIVRAAGYNPKESAPVVIEGFNLPSANDITSGNDLKEYIETVIEEKFNAILNAVIELVNNSEIILANADDFASTPSTNWTPQMWDALASVYGDIEQKLKEKFTIQEFTGLLTITPASPAAGDTLTAVYTPPEGGLTYQWKKDGVIVGTNSSTFIATGIGVYTVTISKDGYESISASVTISTDNRTPEQKPTAQRWGSWQADDSTATVSHSVDASDVCTITVGGTAMTGLPAWNYAWKVNASYAYTATAGKNYTIEFDAWTQSGTRKLAIQWYGDDATDTWLGTGYTGTETDAIPTFEINSTRQTYTIYTEDYWPYISIPKSGVQALEFHCANQTGTFYVKVHSITARDPVSSGGDNYTMYWGIWHNETYSNVAAQFSSGGAPLISAGTNAGYLTGSDASLAFNIISNNYPFNEAGDAYGTFENLLNFQNDGIGAPQALKNAMLANKANVPVGGVFQVSVPGIGNSVVAFYVEIDGVGGGGTTGGGGGVPIIPPGGDTPNDDQLIWGIWLGITYSEVASNFSSAGAPLTTAGSNTGYLKGLNAHSAWDILINSPYGFDDSGWEYGPFADLVNFENEGIGAPTSLKNTMIAEKNNAPLLGVFETFIPGEGTSVVVFYIELW